MADCETVSDWKCCVKKSAKLITDETQCCCCETPSVGDMGPNFSMESWMGYPTKDLEDYLKTTTGGFGGWMKMKMSFSCFDKNIKSTYGYWWYYYWINNLLF